MKRGSSGDDGQRTNLSRSIASRSRWAALCWSVWWHTAVLTLGSALLLYSLIRGTAGESVSLLTNLLPLTLAVSICVPIIAPAEESAGSTTAAVLWNVNVPNTGRGKLVTFPTAPMTAGHPREGTATRTIPRRVCALQAGKVSLLIDMEKLLVRGCLFYLWLLRFNWEYLRMFCLARISILSRSSVSDAAIYLFVSKDLW